MVMLSICVTCLWSRRAHHISLSELSFFYRWKRNLLWFGFHNDFLYGLLYFLQPLTDVFKLLKLLTLNWDPNPLLSISSFPLLPYSFCYDSPSTILTFSPIELVCVYMCRCRCGCACRCRCGCVHMCLSVCKQYSVLCHLLVDTMIMTKGSLEFRVNP